ncbi:hypothetical protein JCM10207_004072 [Rhodosporidiobolus poonsookiae]
MDEPGKFTRYHARRRAEREQRQAAADAKLGLHGLKDTQPLVDDTDTLREKVKVPEEVDGSIAGAYAEPGYRPPPLVSADEIPGPKPASGTVPTVEPVAPPKGQRRRMNPHLACMTGVMLRYDTTIDRVWHGFAMLVTSETGSDYSTAPTMTLEWDATGGALADKLQGMHIADIPDDDSAVHRRTVQGQKIYTYHSLAGPQDFWRFKLEIPMGEREEEVFYSVNNGPESSFWVAAADQDFRVMYHSCNGFSSGVDTASFNGPDPLWRDVLRKHEEKPIHIMVGGGDQIYCDPLTKEPEIAGWIEETDVAKKIAAPLTPDMRLALDRFFFNWYCSWFRGGAFGVANGKIPMLNMLDDHDMIDGFGSYPDDLQQSPVFSSIGSAGYKWFLLFQMFIADDLDGTDPASAIGSPQQAHPSKALILGGEGAFIPFPNHSFLSYLGPKQYILMVDWRSERRFDQLASKVTYERCEAAVKALPPGVQHLVVLLGVPIAYPRMVGIEKVLENKFNPMSLLAKANLLPSAVNKFNAEAELKDDLADHPCAGAHKEERNWLVERFQLLATEKKLRVTFVSGDVHATAQSKFFSTKKVKPEEDPKYMLQIISSAIVNTPPPPAVIWLVSKLGSKTHKTLHKINTGEELIPIFEEDTDGSKPKSTTVMGRRNYAITDYNEATDEIEFKVCVEKSQGSGTTREYPLNAPAPRW